jgi:hypothetical protein
VSPVRYELGFYIPEDDILHSHCVNISNLTLQNIISLLLLVSCPLVEAAVTIFFRAKIDRAKAEDCNIDKSRSIQLYCVTNGYPVANHILL